MPGDVIAFSPGSAESGEPARYRRVPPFVVARLFEELRGMDNNDYVLIVNTSAEEGRVIQSGCLSGVDANDEVMEHLADLYDYLDDNAPDSLASNDWAICTGDDGLNAVYLPGAQGIVGVGYSDSADCPKGMMMAVLTAYCFALNNVDVDRELARFAYGNLPFAPSVGLSRHFFAFAESFFEDAIRNL